MDDASGAGRGKVEGEEITLLAAEHEVFSRLGKSHKLRTDTLDGGETAG